MTRRCCEAVRSAIPGTARLFVCFVTSFSYFFLVMCARLSWSLSFWVNVVKLLFRIIVNIGRNLLMFYDVLLSTLYSWLFLPLEWYTMVCHGIPWYDIPWYTMVNRGKPLYNCSVWICLDSDNSCRWVLRRTAIVGKVCRRVAGWGVNSPKIYNYRIYRHRTPPTEDYTCVVGLNLLEQHLSE